MTTNEQQSPERVLIKNHSEKLKQYITSQFELLGKGKSPFTLIELIENYQLDPKCQNLDQQLLIQLVVGYIFAGDYLSLKHLCSRYNVQKIIDNVKQLAIAGDKEELKLFSAFFDKAIESLKGALEKSGIPVFRNFNKALKRAKIAYIMSVYAKYYVNIDLKSIQTMAGLTQNQLKEYGYRIQGKFVELDENCNLKKDPKQNQEMLSKKIKHLAVVADIMASNE